MALEVVQLWSCQRRSDLMCQLPNVRTQLFCHCACEKLLDRANYSFLPENHIFPAMRDYVLYRGRKLMGRINCSLP